MDTLAFYRETTERILNEHTRIPFSHGVIEQQTVFDRESDHYLLMLIGWEGKKRVHGCLIHVDIIDGKLWIQRDGTEYGIARELIEAGIPKDRIVLAWKHIEMRKGTEFAVA